MKKSAFSRFFAFTLAEVLITLTIIGIVAAITIPTLINNYQKKQYVTSLKKFYTNFNQVLAQVAVDKGCPGNLACTDLFGSGTTNFTLGESLIKYFKVARKCKTYANKGCWANKTPCYFDGTVPSCYYTFNSDTSYKFTTMDNISISLVNYAPNGQSYTNCKYSGFSRNKTGHLKQVCGYLFVDVNGPQKPNIYGRDTFRFWISNGRGPQIYPVAGLDDTGYWKIPNPVRCSPGSADGYYCAARIIEEGWEMNY